MMLRFLWYCLQLSRTQWFKPRELDVLRRKRLRAIVKHAYEGVQFYREKFDSSGVKPEDISSVEDLCKLPFTTKSEIRDHIPGKAIAKGYEISDLVKKPTSGTSGGPMPVYHDKRFCDYGSAAYYRLRRAMGINPWDKFFRIQFWGPMPKPADSVANTRRKGKSHWQASLGLLYFMFKGFQKTVFITHDADEIISSVIDYRPKVLRGNPSYLRLVAEKLAERGISLNPKAIQTSGEVLDEPTRRFLESSFGCEVFDSYWSNETGSISWECRKKEGQHINDDLLILEVVRDGEPVGPGEEGEIVVTCLLNYAMPLIRYRMGDIGVLDGDTCSCGRGLSLLKSVEGRAVDCFTLTDGRKITPKQIMTVIQSEPGVSRYQAVQENERRVTIELMRKQDDPEVSVSNLASRCRQILGEDVEIDVSIGTRENLKAKFRPVVSKLTVAGEPRWTRPRY